MAGVLQHPLAYMMQLGERAPMTITAAGLAILAYLDRDDWPAGTGVKRQGQYGEGQRDQA